VRFPAAGRAPPPPASAASCGSGDASMAKASSAAADAPAAAAGGDAAAASCADADAALAASEAAAAEARRIEQEEAALGAQLAEQYAVDDAGDDAGDYGDDGGDWDVGGDDGSSDGEGGEPPAGAAPAPGEASEGPSAAFGQSFAGLLGGEVRARSGGGALGHAGRFCADAEGCCRSTPHFTLASALLISTLAPRSCCQGLEGIFGSEGLPLLQSLASSAGVTRGAGWAGSSYWRYTKAAPRDAPAKRGAEDKPAKRARK
jgi:hypothetical protein